MTKKLAAFFSLLVFAFSTLTATAQTQIIKGKITDSKGNALEGVTIKLAKSKTNAISAKNGTYTINASINDVLEFSYIGFESKRQTVLNSELNISLNASSTDLQDVILVGTRGSGRAKIESPVPVDVIKLSEVGLNTARMDLTSSLNYAAPSFNYNKQSGADGADHVDIGTLRGLGPDQTLVLVNGKRRHSTALVGLFGTRGRGGSGVDLNGFSQFSVDRIEILRDGAAAQYGSDAIAGVMNVVLKKNIGEWNIVTGIAGYYDKKFNTFQFRDKNDYLTARPIDGVTQSFSINRGFALGKKGGFVNLSYDFLDQGKTFRQAASSNIEDKDGLPTNTWRQGFGDASMNSHGTMMNLELPIGNNGMKFYSFGGMNIKKSDAYAYTRNWSAKPNRFPITSTGDVIFVRDIMFNSGSGDISYNPRILADIKDMSLAAGVTQTTSNGWNWDLSNTMGYNGFHYFGAGTFNASNIGNPQQTSFDDGGFEFIQNTTNLDFSKQFGIVNQGGVKMSFGAELRNEKYNIFQGEYASFAAFPNSLGFEQAPGAQGFPGFSPDDKVRASRNVTGGYVDFEYTPNEALLLTGAIRGENYSDFGSVATYKTSFRYKLTENFNFRGSFSTGYRAPSLQQKYFSNTLTSFSQGQLVQSRVARNDDAITKLAGIPALKQETSVNKSIGFTWKPFRNFSLTVDGYNIQMKDRVVLSGLFSASDETLPAALTKKLNSLGVATAQFFANAVNTTNTGVDVVADYNWRISANQKMKFLFVANFQGIKIDDIHVPAALNTNSYNASTFFNDREQYFLKASAPESKYSFSVDYAAKKFTLGARMTYFGNLQLTGFGYNGDGINPMVPTDANEEVFVPEVFNYRGKTTTDLYASLKLSKSTTWVFGADNIFNIHPDFAVVPTAKYWAGDNETGGPWDGVQMGYNGLRIFTKLAFKF
jgi:iron complex outermembrane receptor protein